MLTYNYQILMYLLLTDNEGLITEFECVTVSNGIECSFLVIITHECATRTSVLLSPKSCKAARDSI